MAGSSAGRAVAERRGMQPDSLYDLPVVEDPRLSPDGQLVAFTVTQADLETGDYRSAIWLVPADGSGEPLGCIIGETASQ